LGNTFTNLADVNPQLGNAFADRFYVAHRAALQTLDACHHYDTTYRAVGELLESGSEFWKWPDRSGSIAIYRKVDLTR